MNPLIKIAREQLLRMLDGHRVQLSTPVGLLEAEAGVDTEWQPLRQSRVPRHIIIHHRHYGTTPPDEIWSNETYEVMVHREDHGGVHLSIKRYDRAAVHNWRHFQQMKNEICGEFREAIELYPSEARVADNANQYHLFVLPEGVEVPIGFPSGMVSISPEDVAAYNEAGGPGRQEPMQPGLTVGQKMDEAQREQGISAQAELRAKGLNT